MATSRLLYEHQTRANAGAAPDSGVKVRTSRRCNTAAARINPRFFALRPSLLYLKNSFNLSDEELVERWAENVQRQFFSGMDYYEPRLPCDPTQIGRFRRLLGEDGIEQKLQGHHRDGQ